MSLGFDNLLKAALKDLEDAIDEMLQPTKPRTPWPRPRQFYLADEVRWPVNRPSDLNSWYKVAWDYRGHYRLDSAQSCLRLAQELISAAGHQPRLIFRTLRRIQAATAWCQARAEGRRRAAEEILRQQNRAAEALEAEAAMLALGKK